MDDLTPPHWGAPAPQEPIQPKCDHDYEKVGTIGLCIVYECRKCGDEYEKDVS